MMNASNKELLNKYKSVKEALGKEKAKRLHLQEQVTKLEHNFAESKSVNTKLAGDLEAKEEKIMSLSELLRQEQLNNIAHDKNIIKQNQEINTWKGTLSELLDAKGKYKVKVEKISSKNSVRVRRESVGSLGLLCPCYPLQ